MKLLFAVIAALIIAAPVVLVFAARYEPPPKPAPPVCPSPAMLIEYDPDARIDVETGRYVTVKARRRAAISISEHGDCFLFRAEWDGNTVRATTFAGTEVMHGPRDVRLAAGDVLRCRAEDR
jgi:hypothetical protein